MKSLIRKYPNPISDMFRWNFVFFLKMIFIFLFSIVFQYATVDESKVLRCFWNA